MPPSSRRASRRATSARLRPAAPAQGASPRSSDSESPRSSPTKIAATLQHVLVVLAVVVVVLLFGRRRRGRRRPRDSRLSRPSLSCHHFGDRRQSHRRRTRILAQRCTAAVERDRPPHHDTQRLALSACVDCPAPLARCGTPRRVREPPRGTTERLARHPAPAFRPRISVRPAQVVRAPETRARKSAPPRSSATARRNWSAARCLSSPCGAPLATNSRSSSRPGPRRSRPRLRDRPPERPPHHDTQRLALSACVDCPAPLARCGTPRRVREPPRGTTERLARHPAPAFRPRISDRPAQVVRARVDQPADEHARRHRDSAARPATQ